MRLLPLLLLLITSSAYADAPRAIKIYKAERKMTYEENGKIVRTFKVALGGAPEGDKVQRGDSKTPEGEFYVGTKNDKSSFHRFLGLSYPMPDDGDRALKEGWID